MLEKIVSVFIFFRFGWKYNQPNLSLIIGVPKFKLLVITEPISVYRKQDGLNYNAAVLTPRLLLFSSRVAGE